MRTYDAWFPRYALGNRLMFFCRVFSPAVGRGSSALLTFLDRHMQRVKPVNKVLVLLPTDHNKLMMQWKGPNEVSAAVGTNDYKVKVKDKLKVYHANLSKAYIQREEEIEEMAAATTEGLLTSGISTGEPSELELNPDDDDDNDFLEIEGYVAKESIADVKIGPGLNDTEHTEFLELAQEFSSLFTEAPGITNLVQHHINLTSDEPVRFKLYPVPYSMRKPLKKDINDMMKMGVIREIRSLILPMPPQW